MEIVRNVAHNLRLIGVDTSKLSLELDTITCPDDPLRSSLVIPTFMDIIAAQSRCKHATVSTPFEKFPNVLFRAGDSRISGNDDIFCVYYSHVEDTSENTWICKKIEMSQKVKINGIKEEIKLRPVFFIPFITYVCNNGSLRPSAGLGDIFNDHFELFAKLTNLCRFMLYLIETAKKMEKMKGETTVDMIFHITSSKIFELIEILFLTPSCFKNVKVYVNDRNNSQYLAFCEDDKDMMRYFFVYNVPKQLRGSTKLQISELTSSEILMHLINSDFETYRISTADATPAEDRQRRQARWAPHGRRHQLDYDDFDRHGRANEWQEADDFGGSADNLRRVDDVRPVYVPSHYNESAYRYDGNDLIYDDPDQHFRDEEGNLREGRALMGLDSTDSESSDRGKDDDDNDFDDLVSAASSFHDKGHRQPPLHSLPEKEKEEEDDEENVPPPPPRVNLDKHDTDTPPRRDGRIIPPGTHRSEVVPRRPVNGRGRNDESK